MECVEHGGAKGQLTPAGSLTATDSCRLFKMTDIVDIIVVMAVLLART